MNDLINRLARLDGSSSTGSTDIDVAGDLARAHTALGRRRRTRAALAGTGLTLGLGAALGVVAVVGNDTAEAPPTTVAPSESDLALPLVAYTGPQVEGFELGMVPEGYEVQGSDAFGVTLALPGDNSHYLNFQNKVVIHLESQDAPQELGNGKTVDVGGEPGALKGGPGETRTLRYFQGDKLVLIQVWETIDLTDEQVVELAESVNVTTDAIAGVG